MMAGEKPRARKDAMSGDAEARRAARLRTASDFSVQPLPGIGASLGYRKTVRFLKFALPLLALALVVTLAAYSVLYRPDASIAISYSGRGDQQGEIVMKSPRFVGADKNNQPFEVIASEARQHADERSLYELDDVKAKLSLNSGPQLQVVAHKGVLDSNNQLLTLTGPIELSTSDGYHVHTSEAHADLKSGMLSGERPIEASGGFGTIRANGFTANRERGDVTFVGDVKIHFEPERVASK